MFNVPVTLLDNFSPDAMTDYPDKKITIVGGGIAGFFEAYYAYLYAKENNKKVRVTIYEKNSEITDSPVGHLVPNITPYEITSVIPTGREFLRRLELSSHEPMSLRLDDRIDFYNSALNNNFISASTQFGESGGLPERTEEMLLRFAKFSVELWKKFYDDADLELKNILIESNFNPCQETDNQVLHNGYRVDVIYGSLDVVEKANKICYEYQRLGYKNCRLLETPDEAMRIDPFLSDFCAGQSVVDESGNRSWKKTAIAVWRPGGCIDTKIFLPKFKEYLQNKMGTYSNESGITKNCFRVHCERKVESVEYDDTAPNRLNGLRFFNNADIKYNRHRYRESNYVFCTGESIGTLKKLGFKEPEQAGFIGISLILTFPLREDLASKYNDICQHMSVKGYGISSSWRARYFQEKMVIGLAGTVKFGGAAPQDIEIDNIILKSNYLRQLNIMNDILPEIISFVLDRCTRDITLTESDLVELINRGIAQRWVGSRSAAFDGFPTLGMLYNEHGQIDNARTTGNLGSGGASVVHGAVLLSRSSMFQHQQIPESLRQEVLQCADSQRTGCF